jgi:hypothetical protein
MHSVLALLSLLILIISVAHLGEAGYSFVESQERKDDFGKEKKDINIHQMASTGGAVLFALIGLGLWHSKSENSKAYLALAILSLGLIVYFILINEAGINKLKAYKQDGGDTEEKKGFKKRANNIYVVNMIIAGLLLLFAIVCGVSYSKYKPDSSSSSESSESSFGRKRKSRKVVKSRRNYKSRK